MAKTCKVEREKRIAKLSAKYKDRREALIAVIKDPGAEDEAKMEAQRELAKIPRNASPIRYRNRCQLTGRPRAYMRKFRLCRVQFRDLALEGKLPGVTKSSW